MAARHSVADPIAQQLKLRRAALGLSLAQASARAGIKAPSFLHHIERGERVPSEEVVAWLAAPLREDENLLRAWVRLRRGAPLDLALEAARLLERHLASAGNGEPSNGTEPGPPLLMRVPRLAWGTDPSNDAAAEEMLRFDPRSLPEEAWLRPFAYRLPEGIDPTPPLAPADLVLITRNAWPLHPSRLYLVRMAAGLHLGRALWREDTLWLESDRGSPPRPLPPSGHPPADLLGRVGAVIRAGELTPAL
jgi:transcriptional regulator with XRE-family HTH domain